MRATSSGRIVLASMLPLAADAASVAEEQLSSPGEVMSDRLWTSMTWDRLADVGRWSDWIVTDGSCWTVSRPRVLSIWWSCWKLYNPTRGDLTRSSGDTLTGVTIGFEFSFMTRFPSVSLTASSKTWRGVLPGDGREQAGADCRGIRSGNLFRVLIGCSSGSSSSSIAVPNRLIASFNKKSIKNGTFQE